MKFCFPVASRYGRHGGGGAQNRARRARPIDWSGKILYKKGSKSCAALKTSPAKTALKSGKTRLTLRIYSRFRILIFNKTHALLHAAQMNDTNFRFCKYRDYAILHTLTKNQCS